MGIILWELLAGRKLFQGESDLQTVQMVQRAQIPSISGINPRVPKELERVIARALARDPAERYQQSRDLARDLNAFLYHHGRPVGSWDIAELVQRTMQARQRERPAGAVSIIDKLIEEALFEFTSLRSNEDPKAKSRDSSGSRPKFASMQDWASEINIKPPIDTSSIGSAGQDALPMPAYEEGNLAALEDDDVPDGSTPVPSSPKPISAAEPPIAIAPAPYPLPPQVMPQPAAPVAVPAPVSAPVPVSPARAIHRRRAPASSQQGLGPYHPHHHGPCRCRRRRRGLVHGDHPALSHPAIGCGPWS